MSGSVIVAVASEAAEIRGEAEAADQPSGRKAKSDANPISNEEPKPKRKERPPRMALSVPETAETLGTSDATVWRWIADKKLATVKIGGRRFVPIPSISGLLASTE
jgi:excisionase family DNA binding protein